MQLTTPRIQAALAGASWIRRMFEQGRELKQRVGTENVFDFSLGNPDLPPPPEAATALSELAATVTRPLALGYVPNAGLPELRDRLAQRLATEQQCALSAEQVIVTCGAAGALNALFRAVLEPDDEIICPAPYFVEYGFYVGNYGGVLKPVATRRPDFGLDTDAIEAAIGPRTRAILINSPNNPSGAVYDAASLEALSQCLARHNSGRERPIYLVMDEPYRFLAYDGASTPPILPLSPFAIVVGSFSKSLSLAGERVGYLALSPELPGGEELAAAITLTNRILGYVNAPVIGQILVGRLLDNHVDLSIYAARREAMAALLDAAGVSYSRPQGAFYFFPEVPGSGDDKAFAAALLRENVLVVPGSGFGCPGYVRLTFCMDEAVIHAAKPALTRAVRAWTAADS